MYTAEELNVAMNNCKSAATAYKTVANTPAVTKVAIDAAEKKLREALADYNKKVRTNAYETICAGEDVVATAAKAFSFSGLATRKITKESGTDRIKNVEIETEDTEPYRLKLLESTYSDLNLGDLMHDQKWSSRTYRARLYAAAAECKLLKCDMQKFRDAFTMTGDMLVYTDDGQPIDVCDMTENEKNAWTEELTINQIMKRLQTIVDNILFDTTGRDDGQNRYRIRREDARFFMQYMFWLDDKTGKPHIRTPEKTMHLMFVVLSHVVSGVAYDVIWREEK